MRITVLGATGRTGSRVVDEALGAGHEVVAVARGADALPVRRGLQARAGDVRDPEVVASASLGCDAVVSALGVGASRAATWVYSSGLGHVVAGLAAQRRPEVPVVAVSAAPVGSPTDHPLVTRTVVLPALRRLFGPTYDDMRRMEDLLAVSAGTWVVLRPPRLVTGPAVPYRLVEAGNTFLGREVSTGTLARALLESITVPERHARVWYVR
jgi:nucleoside-diphosphate-sugar epimerase